MPLACANRRFASSCVQSDGSSCACTAAWKANSPWPSTEAMNTRRSWFTLTYIQARSCGRA